MMRWGKARDRLQGMSIKLRQNAAMLVDWLIALALGGLVLGEMSFSSFAGPRPVNALLFLSVCLTLLWRRRAPLVMLFIAVAVLGIQANFFDPPNQPPLSTFIILLVVFYSAAAYGDGRRAVIGAAVAFMMEIVIIDIPRFLAGENPGDIIPAWVIYVIFWFVGRTIRQRQLQAVELEDRATRLEIEREEHARAAVAEERSRISRELHDVVAHSVSVIVVQAQAAQRLLEGEQREARQALGSIETTGRQALTEMRRLLGILRRTEAELVLAPQPSLSQLDALIEQLRASGLPVELRIEGEAKPLPPGVDLSAYRIVQEALTNSLKHAGPSHAQVVIHYRANELALEITDDGTGNGEGGGAGQGLIGMRERVTLYGGVFQSGRRESGGYSVRARLPLDSDRS